MVAADESYTATADGSGVAVVTIRPFGRQTWTVRQVGVTVTPLPAGAKAHLSKNGVQVTPIILADTGGAAGGEPPMMLSPSDTARVTFSGLTPAQGVAVFMIYDDGT